MLILKTSSEGWYLRLWSRVGINNTITEFSVLNSASEWSICHYTSLPTFLNFDFIGILSIPVKLYIHLGMSGFDVKLISHPSTVLFSKWKNKLLCFFLGYEKYHSALITVLGLSNTVTAPNPLEGNKSLGSLPGNYNF